MKLGLGKLKVYFITNNKYSKTELLLSTGHVLLAHNERGSQRSGSTECSGYQEQQDEDQ